jgi:hypothetical protein
MSIRQARIMPLNSTAGPLPIRTTGTRFPLTAGSVRCIQEVDLKRILMPAPQFSNA